MQIYENEIIVLIALNIALLLYIYFFDGKLLEEPEDEEEQMQKPQKPTKRIRGWIVTWIDSKGDYANVSWENNLMIAYGEANVFPDGRIETDRESLKQTYYQGEEIRRLNPFLNDGLIQQYGKMNEDGKLIWADGTDRNRSPYEVQLPVLEEQQSKHTTSKAVKGTSKWLFGRKDKDAQ